MLAYMVVFMAARAPAVENQDVICNRFYITNVGWPKEGRA